MPSKYIIDAHAHIASWPTIKVSEDCILSGMKKHKILFTLVSDGDSVEWDNKDFKYKTVYATQKKALKDSIKFARDNPMHIGVLLWCRPLKEGLTEEIENMVLENRDVIYGLKFHPYYSLMPITDDRMKPYLEFAKKYHLLVLVHTATNENSSILHLEKVAKLYPTVIFVAAHLEMLSDHKEAIRIVKENDNIYADTAWVPLADTKELIKACGKNKIMFGTDSPIDLAKTLDNPIYKEYYAKGERVLGKRNFDSVMRNLAIQIYRLPVIL